MMLWNNTSSRFSENNAMGTLFDDPILQQLGIEVLEWIKEYVPCRCGVRLGIDRVSFLLGNYRPAAIKNKNDVLRLEMAFLSKLPDSFEETSFKWKTIDNIFEGYTVVEKMPLQLNSEDIENFILACKKMIPVAPKSRFWDCNVDIEWPENKPYPIYE